MGGFCSPPPVQYYGPLYIVPQSQSLLDLIPQIYVSPPLHIHREFDLVIAGWPRGFPHFPVIPHSPLIPEKVTGKKARGPQMEQIGYKCQTLFSPLS